MQRITLWRSVVLSVTRFNGKRTDLSLDEWLDWSDSILMSWRWSPLGRDEWVSTPGTGTRRRLARQRPLHSTQLLNLNWSQWRCWCFWCCFGWTAAASSVAAQSTSTFDVVALEESIPSWESASTVPPVRPRRDSHLRLLPRCNQALRQTDGETVGDASFPFNERVSRFFFYFFSGGSCANLSMQAQLSTQKLFRPRSALNELSPEELQSSKNTSRLFRFWSRTIAVLYRKRHTIHYVMGSAYTGTAAAAARADC